MKIGSMTCPALLPGSDTGTHDRDPALLGYLLKSQPGNPDLQVCHIRTLTVIYDAGTEAEEIYTFNINENVLVSSRLKDGYAEERRKSFEGNGLGNLTIWAVPVSTETESLKEQ